MDYLLQTWQMILNFDAHLPDLVAMHANLVYFILFGVIFLQIGILPLFFLPSNPFLFVCGAVWAAVSATANNSFRGFTARIFAALSIGQSRTMNSQARLISPRRIPCPIEISCANCAMRGA